MEILIAIYGVEVMLKFIQYLSLINYTFNDSMDV